MIQLNINNKIVYSHGIIHPEELARLYEIEKPLAEISARVKLEFRSD